MKFTKLMTIGMAAVALFFTTACPRDIANKVAERSKLTDEYNEKSSTANSLDSQLMVLGVDVDSSPTTSSRTTFDLRSPAEREDIRTKLEAFISTIGRMIEIANHGNMDNTISESEKSKLQRKLVFAQDYRDMLNKPVVKSTASAPAAG